MPAKSFERVAVFEHPLKAVHKAVVDVLMSHGFEIRRSEPHYVEGFKPMESRLTGSVGNAVRVWLKPLGASETQVKVVTARTGTGVGVGFAVGRKRSDEIAGQKDWPAEIFTGMKRRLVQHGQ